MANNDFDVSMIDPSTRRELLESLRKKFGSEVYETMLENSTENDLLSFAIQQQILSGDQGLLGNNAVRKLRLDRMRRRIGSDQYNAFLRTHSEAELLELESKIFAPVPSTDSGRSTRTRESSQRVSQIIMLLALAYGALLGSGYPDWVKFGQVFESIFYWVVGAVFVIGLILVLFFRTSFDFGNIWLWGFIVAALVSTVIGLGANLFTIGIKVLGVAGVAAVGAYLFGMLFGRPVFRWLERTEKEWVRWVFGILAGLIAVGVLILGWIGIVAVFPTGVL